MFNLAATSSRRARSLICSTYRFVDRRIVRCYGDAAAANVVHSRHGDCDVPNCSVVQRFFETTSKWPDKVAIVSFSMKIVNVSQLTHTNCRFICIGMRNHGTQIHLRSGADAEPSVRQRFDADGLQTGRCVRHGSTQHSGISDRSVRSFRSRNVRVFVQPPVHGW